MEYTIIFVFLCFFAIIFLDRFYTHSKALKTIQKIKFCNKKILETKMGVKCWTMTVGRKNLRFIYRNADLYFLEDALIIAGFYYLFKNKVFRSVLIATKEVEFYRSIFNNADEIIFPKKLNLNSSKNDVYLEFGEAGFTTSNVEIRIHNLTETEKKQIKI